MAGLSLLESISNTSSAREQGRIQSDYLKDASSKMRKAKDAFDKTLNPSLQSAVFEGRRASDIVSSSGQQNIMQARKQQDAISKATGFASMSMDNDMIKNIRSAYTTKMEDLDIGLTKNLASILSDFEKTKFEMQSQKEQLDMQRKLADQQSQSKYLGIFG
tara:strand:+ start:574 stop:1056 length:483 start_codon:yes stop_codon:yes gene_type:complete